MMKKTILILALLSFVLLNTSCSKKCETIPQEVEHLNCENPKYTLHIDLDDDYTFIRSKKEYDDLVSGSCHPDIDFSKYVLLIGKQSSGNQNSFVNYSLEKKCKQLLLTIDVIEGNATAPDNITYHVLILKTEEDNLHITVNTY